MNTVLASVWPRRNYAAYVLALLTLAYGLAILDRVSIALLIGPLQGAFAINDTEFGLLQGLAFSIAYSVLGLPLGMLCDRRRRVPILAGGLAVWSFATMACSMAQSFEQLFVARMFVGAGEAALVPVATSLIADYFAPPVRPKAYGVFVTGSTLGTAAAMILGGLFLSWSDSLILNQPWLFGGMEPWQIVFLLCGLPGVLLAGVLLLTVREPVRQGGAIATEPLSLRPIVRLFASQPKAHGLFMLGSVFNLVCIYAIVGWFPALFIRAHGWTAAETGKLLGLTSLPISLFAALNSGWVIAWLAKRGRADAPVLTAMGCSVAMLLFATSASLVPNAWVALGLFLLNALFLNWNTSATYTGLAQITPNALRAQVMAVQTIVSGLVALTAGNFLVGFLSDRVFTSPDGIALSLATLFATCSLAAIACLAASRKAFAKATAAVAAAEAP